MIKQYSSFAEIDEQLHILWLKREIGSESIKLNLNRAKAGFHPSKLLGGFRGMVQKAVLIFTIKTLSRLFGNKHSVA